MSGFVYPPSQRREGGFSRQIAEIKAWTRRALSLDDEAVVSVNELACSQPGCPPKQTVILVLKRNEAPLKIDIHKCLLEVFEQDIAQAEYEQTLSKRERSHDPPSKASVTNGVPEPTAERYKLFGTEGERQRGERSSRRQGPG